YVPRAHTSLSTVRPSPSTALPPLPPRPPPSPPLSPSTTLFRSGSTPPRPRPRGRGRASCSAPRSARCWPRTPSRPRRTTAPSTRSEEHTSELQSRFDIVCRLLLEKKQLLIVVEDLI